MINETTPVIGSVGTVFSLVMTTIQYLIGGIFGLYVLMFMYKILTYKKFDKKIDQIMIKIDDISDRLKEIEESGVKKQKKK